MRLELCFLFLVSCFVLVGVEALILMCGLSVVVSSVCIYVIWFGGGCGVVQLGDCVGS